MPRPRKNRRICRMPTATAFMPADGSGESVILTVDEYETIRLMDHDGLNQEQAALQMGVARATVTCIYESARRKIAQALVESRGIVIRGGSYTVCENADNCCGRCGCANCADCDNAVCKACIAGMVGKG